MSEQKPPLGQIIRYYMSVHVDPCVVSANVIRATRDWLEPHLTNFAYDTLTEEADRAERGDCNKPSTSVNQ